LSHITRSRYDDNEHLMRMERIAELRLRSTIPVPQSGECDES
jgi:hypothetical protein